MIHILGGGIAGLLAAYELRQHRPLLLESRDTLGGMFTAGGLKYIRNTPEFCRLLQELGVWYEVRRPRGMILVEGVWHDHPDWLSGLPAETRAAIQLAHWVKTRGSTDRFRGDCMNDPLGNGGDTALWFDHEAFLRRLAEAATAGGATLMTSTTVRSVSDEYVACAGPRGVFASRYTHMINTLPLPLIGRLAQWARFPDARSRWVVIVGADVGASEPQWDYAYAPLLQSVSRVSWPRSGHLQFEIPTDSPPALDARASDLDIQPAVSALETFMDTGLLQAVWQRAIPGHLLPLDGKLREPQNWLMLGRFAEWNPRATAEQVLDRVTQWRHWYEAQA